MASSRGFVICVCVLQLGVSIKGWLNTDMNIGMPLHTVASVAESTINAAQMELQMMDLKLHIDQSLEYLASKFDIMLERVLLETSAFCERELKHGISTLKSALLPKPKDGMECEDLRDDIKDILHGQQQVVDQLANVSSSREIKVARLEHQLRAAAHGSEEYEHNPDGRENGSFFVRSVSANNRLYGDGWLVFQQRYDGTVDFYRNWTEYRDGFGDLGGEFWLGLEKLHRLLSSGPHYELLVELEDFQGVTAFEHYNDFLIGDESENYALKHLGRGTGTAGDSLVLHKGMNFSTYDHTANDCPSYYHGAWWFLQCYDAHLNGRYLIGKHSYRGGIIWHTFRGSFESLQATRMMVRPLEKIDHDGKHRIIEV
uniref:Fibrinogen C-terminal domain-containing protein n=3 Tax=gambiae species complex TaxID=44542 RepID=A0A8W7PHS1_ANOCL